MSRPSIRRLAAIACLVILPVTPVRAADRPAEVQGLLTALARALEAGDLDATLSLYSASPDVMAVESRGTVHRGPEGIRAMYVQAYGEVRFEAVTLSIDHVVRLGDAVVCHAVFGATTALRHGGQRFRLETQATWVVRPEGGRPVIVHEHFSPREGVDRVRPVPVP